MHINWFTVIAQLVNFALLVWLMKRFLYAPVLAAIDAREKKITAQLNAAKTQKAEAKTEHEEFTKKNTDFDAQKQALLATATADAKTQRQKLLEAAHQEAEAQRTKQQKALQQTQDDMQDDIARQTRQTVFSLTKKALTDLASVDLESQTVATLLQRLQALDAAARQPLLDAFQADKKPMQVQSAFPLTDDQQAAITTALTQLLGAAPAVAFSTNPALISGISLNANGFQLAWSATSYLAALEKSKAAAADKRQTASQLQSAPQPAAPQPQPASQPTTLPHAVAS